MSELGNLDIKLTASGLDAVLAAFKTVEERLNSLNKLSKVAQSIALAEAKARLEVAKAATQEAKAKTNAAKAADKAERDSVKEKQKSEKEKTSIVDKEEKARLAIRERSQQMAHQLLLKEVRDEENAAKKITASRKQAARSIAGGVSGAVGSTLGLASRVLTAGLALGGGFSLGSAYQREANMSKQATQIDVQSRGDFSKASAIAQARRIGKELNVDENEYLQGSYEFLLNTGKGKMTQDVMPALAHLAKAEGVDISELGRAAGMVSHQNADMTNNEVLQFMRNVVGQGKSELGSVSLEEMTRVLSEATSKSGFYSGNQGDNQMKLASLVQIGKATTRGVEESGTAVQHITQDVIKHRKNAAWAFEDDGKLKDVNYIISHAIGSTGGDATKLMKIFGERSIAIPAALLPTYQAAEKEKKGSGEAAVFDYLKNVNRERITQAEENADLAKKQADQFEQLDKAMKDLERAVGTELVPVLVSDLIPAIRDATPSFVKLLHGMVELIEWIEKHPWEAAFAGLGVRIGTAIVEQIVKTEFTNLLAAGITKVLPGAALPGAAGAASNLTLTGAVLATGAGAMGTTAAIAIAAKAGAGYAADQFYGSERDKMNNDQLESDIAKRQAIIATLKKHQWADDPTMARANRDQIAQEEKNIRADQAKLQEADAKFLGEVIGNGFLETVQKNAPKFDFMADNGGTNAGPRGAGGSGLSGGNK